MTTNTIAPTEPAFVDPSELFADPQGTLARYRSDFPVIRHGEQRYAVLRATDVAALLADPRIRQVEGRDYARLSSVPPGPAADFLSQFFLFSNGDRHRTRRGLFAKIFAFPAIRARRGSIRRTAERIVSDLPRGEIFDFVETAAARVPAEMIADVLGLPEEDAPRFADLVYKVALLFGPVYPVARHPEIDAAARDLHIYVQEQMSARLVFPGNDVLSGIVTAWREAPAIDFEALAHQVVGLIIGGSDTTRTAVAMTLSLLLRHPDQWAALKADESLLPGAVAEALRYEPSIASTVRFAAEPIEIGGLTIPAGAMVGLSTLSAMRDPALYTDPDRFDIRRTEHPRMHLVFGGGVHRCIGEMLARIEIEETIAAVTRLAPAIVQIEAPRMIGFGGIRQITPMQVRIP
jgi:cytochrome P450 family 103